MVLGGAEGLPCNLEVPILNQPIVSDQAFFSGQYPKKSAVDLLRLKTLRGGKYYHILTPKR